MSIKSIDLIEPTLANTMYIRALVVIRLH